MKIRNAIEANVGKSVAELEKAEAALETTKDISEPKQAPAPKEVRDKEKLKEAKASKTAESFISVNLRLTPDPEGDILCVLYPGIKVDVHDVDYAPGWYGLTYQGRSCFVMKDYIKIL